MIAVLQIIDGAQSKGRHYMEATGNRVDSWEKALDSNNFYFAKAANGTPDPLQVQLLPALQSIAADLDADVPYTDFFEP